jgi:hypothetical protein
MDRRLGFSALVGGLLVPGFACSAFAQDAPATIPGILCDTEAELRSIVAANQESNDAMQAAFQRLNMQLNAQHQPACAVQQMPHTSLSVPKSIDLGSWPENGQAMEAFGLHIQDGTDHWFMYVAPQGFINGFSQGI